jgi:two-component system chemotaxis sensor kinase CheA
VRSNVTRLRGSVGIQTRLGAGTTVTVSLPLTLAISQALLVTVGPATVAIPLVYVVETLRVAANDLYTISGWLVTAFRGAVLPLVALSEILDQGAPRLRAGDLIRVVIAKSGDQQIGLIVDSLVGEQEIVLKPLGAILRDTIGIAGATILGNGAVALALDVASLIGRGNLHAVHRGGDALQ